MRKLKNKTYYYPKGGLPSQNVIASDRSVFTNSYVVIPKTVMKDIVVSYFPHWLHTRAWVLAKPLSGFAETFSQSILEISSGGGSDNPEPDPRAECVLFVLDGELDLIINGKDHALVAGSYAFIPPKSNWTISNCYGEPARIHCCLLYTSPSPRD